MKVYRIKHKPSGLYISNFNPYYNTMSFEKMVSTIGQIYPASNVLYMIFEDEPDYEILYDEIKD